MYNQNEITEEIYSFQGESKFRHIDEKELQKQFSVLSEVNEIESMKSNTNNSSHQLRKNSPYQIYSESTNDMQANNSISLVNKADVDKLNLIIDSCYFEPGIISEADKYFDKLEKNYNGITEPLRILSEITNNNLNNEHTLEGILHILSFKDYEQLEPFGLTISIACAYNHSPIIIDLLISNFEKWDSIKCIAIMEQMNIEYEWINNYKNDVLNYLKRKVQS